MRVMLLAIAWLAMSAPAFAQESPITIHASRVFDGRGKVLENVRIVVQNGRIQRVETGAGPSTHDLRGLTVMPGWIDTHVHIMNHFRASAPRETRIFATRSRAGDSLARES